jgi:DNA topoisomerase-6 subunit B
MLNGTKCRTLLRFLTEEFSSVGRKTASAIIEEAGTHLTVRSYPRHIARAQADALYRALQETRVLAPSTDCIVPIGESQLLDGLRKEVPADFYTVITRPAAAYRGNPFQVEVAMAYGQPGEGHIDIDEGGHMRKADTARNRAGENLLSHGNEPVRLLRFANRVPLLYQQSSGAIAKAVIQTNWRSYGLRQASGALPVAPMAILVHVASVWVPYTSESKEAIEPYPEILKEIRLGLQQCGRRLARYLHHKARLQREYDRRSQIEKYLPHIGIALQEILSLRDTERDAAIEKLDDVLQTSRNR